MDVAYLASWFSWLGDWGRNPNRLTREVIIRIFSENSLDLRVATLNYQIKQMMSKYI